MSYYSGYRKKQHRGIDCGDFEITKREILASVTIVAVLLLIGVLMSSKISEHQMDKNEVYNKAVKIQSTEQFKYGMDTNVGNAFVYGELIAVDTVTFEEIGGAYSYVEKVEEHYNRHTRMVTKTRTNSKGETETYEEEEVYYSWDYYDSWEKQCERIKFCGEEFESTKINLPRSKYLKTDESFWLNVRFVYYGTSTKFSGTIFTCLKDKTISDKTPFYENCNIEETVEQLESGGGVVVFWIFWVVLIGCCVFGFYYIDNEWLEN